MTITFCSAVIFDLDGTLLNTLEDLADSMNAALEDMGFPRHPLDKYRYFVGDGVPAMARRALPAGARGKEMVEVCVEKMKKEYARRWDRKTRLYPGAAPMLDALADLKTPMNILSNKIADFTEKVVDRYLAEWPFRHVAGVSDDIPKKPAPQGALRIAAESGIPPEKFLFLGDSGTDMQTACAAGMVPVGAEWGFRTCGELLENGACEVIRRPMELLKYFQARRGKE